MIFLFTMALATQGEPFELAEDDRLDEMIREFTPRAKG